jgi:hypothetical protein
MASDDILLELGAHQTRLVGLLAEYTDVADELTADLNHEPGPEDQPSRVDGEPLPDDVLEMFSLAQRVGAHSRVIRELARHQEQAAGVDGLADRIAYMLDHSADATPAALDSQFYEIPPTVADTGQYFAATVAAHDIAISELEAIG